MQFLLCHEYKSKFCGVLYNNEELASQNEVEKVIFDEIIFTLIHMSGSKGTSQSLKFQSAFFSCVHYIKRDRQYRESLAIYFSHCHEMTFHLASCAH